MTEKGEQEAKPRRERGEGGASFDKERNRWRASLVVSKPGEKIRRVYGSGKSEKGALAELRRLKSEHDSGTRIVKQMTLSAWLDTWLVESALKPSTRRAYRSMKKNYDDPSIGKTRLDVLGPDHPRAMHKFMTKKDVSDTTVGHAHRLCKAAMNQALGEQRVTANYFALVKPPPNAPTKGKAFNDHEEDVFREFIADRWDEARWLAAITLGMRQGECLGMTWPFVDLDARKIDIAWELQKVGYLCQCKTPCKSHTVRTKCPTKRLDITDTIDHTVLFGGYVLMPPKTKGSRRVVPIPNFMIGPMRRRYVEYLTQRQEPGYTDYGLVFARPNGLPLDSVRDNLLWHTLLAEAGLPDSTLHSARNSAASSMLRHGIDPTIQTLILGHSAYAVTQGYQSAELDQLDVALTKAHVRKSTKPKKGKKKKKKIEQKKPLELESGFEEVDDMGFDEHGE